MEPRDGPPEAIIASSPASRLETTAGCLPSDRAGAHARALEILIGEPPHSLLISSKHAIAQTAVFARQWQARGGCLQDGRSSWAGVARLWFCSPPTATFSPVARCITMSLKSSGDAAGAVDPMRPEWESRVCRASPVLRREEVAVSTGEAPSGGATDALVERLLAAAIDARGSV